MMSGQPSSHSTVGNVGNIFLLSLTTLVTSCMLYQFPRTELFDKNWLQNGFCVSNQETFWWNSHVLSFYAAATSTVAIAYLNYIQPKEAPPIQKAILSGAIMGVLGHGLGHLYLGTNPEGMDLRFRNDDVQASLIATLVTFFGFGAIFNGTMPLASKQKLGLTALISTIGFTILDIEPKVNFVYAQAVIYISNAIHMLYLPAEHKSTTAYMLFPYVNIPVLAVGVMESTGCESYLKYFGGHAVFDSTIAVGIIMSELLSNHMQTLKEKST